MLGWKLHQTQTPGTLLGWPKFVPFASTGSIIIATMVPKCTTSHKWQGPWTNFDLQDIKIETPDGLWHRLQAFHDYNHQFLQNPSHKNLTCACNTPWGAPCTSCPMMVPIKMQWSAPSIRNVAKTKAAHAPTPLNAMNLFLDPTNRR